METEGSTPMTTISHYMVDPVEPTREQLADAISDMSKDATGSRYRVNWQAMTLDELKADFLYWEKAVLDSIDEDERRFAQAQADWEKHIMELIALGAGTRKRAIVWDMQAMGRDGEDVGSYVYHSGLPCKYDEVVREALR
jgi:hypothetical protein